MARRKQTESVPESPPRNPDRHTSTYMVRLPEVYRERFRALTKRTRRTMTTEIKMALEEYLAKQGLWDAEKDGA